MTDPVTEAVRRLRDLRTDVERLKAGRGQEGQTRFLRIIRETASCSDTVTVVDQGTPFRFDDDTTPMDGSAVWSK